MAAKYPTPHIMATPNDIANAFVFLASDDSSYMTGQVIHNNGGQVMG